jgi:chromosome segregation ATPase
MADDIKMLEFLAERIEKIESRLEKYIEENTKRLDTLIEITRHMSAINERQTRHSDDISEVKARISTLESTINSSLNRAHQRIDEVKSGCDDKFFNLDQDYKSWKNRAQGFFAAVTIIFGLIQFIGYSYITATETKINIVSVAAEKMKTKINDLENQINFSIANNNKQ